MSACLGCSCSRPTGAGAGGRLLLSTRVSHNERSLRAVLRAEGASVVERAPGLLEVAAEDPTVVLAAARRALTTTEAAEVRAVVLGDQTGDALLGAAFGASTLAQLGARVEHADLVPLFADETRAFRSVYQPIVALDGPGENPVIGYEALLRATGPDGPLMPGDLFAAAHDAGWLHVLDRVGRTTALRGAQGWLEDALLFVNFIPTTIYRPEVCLTTTERAAEEAGLRLDQLVFEVTESERIGDLDHLADVFAYYRQRGCQVALDDLGSGYSSLNVLVRLQPDIVKLDKDIVQRLPGSTAAAVVSAVVDITHSYGGTVLAECIETQEQADAARELGVDLGQGWHFGRPQERSAVAEPERSPREQAAAATAWAAGPGADGNDRAVALVGAAPAGAAVAGVPAPRQTADALSPRVAGLDAVLVTALEVSATGVSVVNALAPDLPLVWVNPAFELVTGYPADEVLGRNCRFLQGPDTDPEVVRSLHDALTTGQDRVTVLRNYRKDGTAWWNELRVSAVRDDAGRITHYLGFQNDVTAQVEARHEVERTA